MTIVKSADCTETITVMTKMVTVCVTAVLVRLIHMREVRKMTDDTISRAAAIDALGEEPPVWYDGEDEIGERNQWRRDVAAIKALPSAQPGWIPWDSGRFPEESGTYTVTAYDGAKRRVTYAKYQKRLKRWELTGARAYWRVLAWQPQLQPWEGGQDE